jgi:hypothetical protein
MSELPRCHKAGCQGKLTKANKTIHSRTYICKKCGMEHKLEKRIGSGWNFM